jgi:hypothetical protein
MIRAWLASHRVRAFRCIRGSMRSVTFLRSIPNFHSYLIPVLHSATSLHCAKCEASNSTTSPTATLSGLFECLFLAGLQAVFFEATKQVDSSGQRFEPSWLAMESTKLHRFRLSRALRAIIPTVLSRLRRLALWSRMLRAVIARQRANALPSRILPTSLARFRYE